MLASVVHIQPLVTIRRERLLPIPGKVTVRKGQKVAATDIIAEVDLDPKYTLLDVARGLGVSSDEADRYIQSSLGSKVSSGDVLAGPLGFLKRVVRAPFEGEVVFTGEGVILLKRESQIFGLKAGMPGLVAELIEGRGAIITNTGVLVQGVWGNGQIDAGILVGMAKRSDEVITPDKLDISMRGLVVLAGHCAQSEVLMVAADLPLRGMILASMDSRLATVASKLKMPLIVLEGFGQIGMNSASYKLLTTNERREVTINAEEWDRFTGKRPEVIIPLPAPEDMPLPRETFTYESGQTIRALGSPYWGKIGRINRLLPDETQIPNGLMVRAAEVKLENGSDSIIPLSNLEVIA